MLGPRCWERINSETTLQQQPQKFTKVHRILELREDVPSAVVGTIVVESSSSIKKEETLHPDSLRKESDALYLEDESGRVTLGFATQAQAAWQLCTGVVVGLQGTVDANGTLQVQQVFSPAPPPPPALEESSVKTTDKRPSTEGAPHLLLLSGLHCGDPETPSLPRDMLLSFLQGHLGQEKKAASISQIIIAGGLVGHDSAALADLDVFLCQLAATGLPLVVMPGADDPTTANWPQRPLHSALLPRSNRRFKSHHLLRCTPNPYAATHHHQQLVVGTSGANVQDLTKRLLRQQNGNNNNDNDDDISPAAAVQPYSELQALRQTLEWSHMCPTGPDSVPTAPHPDNTDPMVLTQWPRLYFMGNARRFATSKVDSGPTSGTNSCSCRLVCLEQFATTGQAVLVNLETLDVEVLRFVDEE